LTIKAPEIPRSSPKTAWNSWNSTFQRNCAFDESAAEAVSAAPERVDFTKQNLDFADQEDVSITPQKKKTKKNDQQK
jgi:hypothetical protein